ncbi:PREDICTED: ADP-ribosylation factor, partial [Prunus dulcis]
FLCVDIPPRRHLSLSFLYQKSRSKSPIYCSHLVSVSFSYSLLPSTCVVPPAVLSVGNAQNPTPILSAQNLLSGKPLCQPRLSQPPLPSKPPPLSIAAITDSAQQFAAPPAQAKATAGVAFRPLRKTGLLWILESFRLEDDSIGEKLNLIFLGGNKWGFSEKEIRILMVGLDNSGKTTIVLRINGEDTSVVSPTLGFNIKTITYQKYTLNIWDVGGQKTIRSYWRNYFEQTDGLVWVVDSSDLRRLDDCKMELDNLLKEERLSGSSLLILANKQDIKGVLTPEEIAKVLNLEAMDKTRHWEIVGCSAYTGDGLLEGFDWLVQDIASRIYVLD